MLKVIILGTSSALSSSEIDNTYLAITYRNETILIDCAGSPTYKLLKAGINLSSINNIIITHAHVDHIYGLPSLIHNFWLGKRKKDINIFANLSTLEIIKNLIELHQLDKYLSQFKINYQVILEKENNLFFDNSEISIISSPACHSTPSFALKFIYKNNNKTLVYSGDTGPCASVSNLAQSTNMLIHETMCPQGSIDFTLETHTSALEVGQIANNCQVDKLILIHYDQSLLDNINTALNEIRKSYSKEVIIAKEFDCYYL
ncbi:MAG: MBL fold metallo-hydrolase [bacterium]|nr:MBL fold metallo-hydrolase [bacterium]